MVAGLGGATGTVPVRFRAAMITAMKSQARAAEWAARAERAAGGRFKTRLERIARSWAKLAEMAEAEEAEARLHPPPHH
jgi:hypothetical protein